MQTIPLRQFVLFLLAMVVPLLSFAESGRAQARVSDELPIRIVDDTGEPVAGAVIAGKSAFDDPFQLLGLSNQEGTFRVTLRPDATYLNVLVRAEGYGLAARGYSLRKVPDVEDLTIPLRRAAPISGRLVDQSGNPAAGVRIRPYTVLEYGPRKSRLESIDQAKSLFELEDNGRPLVQASISTEKILPWVETDEQGRFTIDSVAPDQLVGLFAVGDRTAATTIIVRTDDGPEFTLRTQRGDAEVPIHPRVDFTHTVGPSAPIIGTITQSDSGRPVPLATVGPPLTPGFSFVLGHRLMQVQTDVFGKYRLIGMGVGVDRVTAAPPHGVPLVAVQRFVNLKPDTLETTLDMQMPTGVRVTGTVTDLVTGEPVSGSVTSYVFSNHPQLESLKPTSLSADRHSAGVADDGRYEIVVLPGRGILTFTASSSVSQNYRRGIGWDRIDHHVYRANGNRTLFATVPEMLTAFNATQLFEVDIPPSLGEYRFDMVVGEERTDVPLRFTHEGKWVPGEFYVRGSLYYSHTTPDSSWEIADPLVSPDPSMAPRISFFSGDKGRVTQAYDRNHLLAGWTFVRPEDKEAVIELKKPATARGRVLMPDGTPIADAALRTPYPIDPTQKQARLPSQPEEGYYPHTDEEGRFEFVGLAPDLPLTVMIDQTDEARNRLLARHYLFEGLELKPGETRDLGDLRIDNLREWTRDD